ncbi:hypothetical protein RF11_14472 [Thelohanellus kitauei]|uniref:Uncharacterized protein n=1 Tax=Thelohanellus kitauei TaxID=669202 RepID=A0A0C2NC41_THEKT|nr:hypothetical protein RF11_14472 [Thelohanellus kitauei]
MEEYMENKISSDSDRFHDVNEVLDYISKMLSKALFLSKQPFVKDDFKRSNTVDGGARMRLSRFRKRKQYIDYILEKRKELKENDICEVSCKNILGYSKNLLQCLLKNDAENRKSGINKAKSEAKGNGVEGWGGLGVCCEDREDRTGPASLGRLIPMSDRSIPFGQYLQEGARLALFYKKFVLPERPNIKT